MFIFFVIKGEIEAFHFGIHMWKLIPEGPEWFKNGFSRRMDKKDRVKRERVSDGFRMGLREGNYSNVPPKGQNEAKKVLL